MKATIILEWLWNSLAMLIGMVTVYGGLSYVWTHIDWHTQGTYMLAAIGIGYLICLHLRWPGMISKMEYWAHVKEHGLEIRKGEPPEDEEE